MAEAARQIVATKDELVKQALTRYLGANWTLGSLKGRAVLQVDMRTRVETLSVDSVALVAFFPPETISSGVFGFTTYVSYKFLYPEPAK